MGSVISIFGTLLSGLVGTGVVLLLALVLAYLAWGTYRLQMAAWWGTLLIGIAVAANMAITYWRGHLMDMYEKMGFPADQMDLIRKSGIVESMSRWGPWLALAGGAVWLGYLLYVRRYFVQGRSGSNSDIARGCVSTGKASRQFVGARAIVMRFSRMAMRKHVFEVMIEQDEAGYYVAECPALRACYTQGETCEEVIENINEVIALCLEDLKSKKYSGDGSERH